MGATRIPVITNPPSDPGRNQPRERSTNSPADIRDGNYRDQQSMAHNPGGAATTRKTWFGSGYEPDGAGHEEAETMTHNGPPPRDRGHRAI
jgi:hypothetical protein